MKPVNGSLWSSEDKLNSDAFSSRKFSLTSTLLVRLGAHHKWKLWVLTYVGWGTALFHLIIVQMALWSTWVWDGEVWSRYQRGLWWWMSKRIQGSVGGWANSSTGGLSQPWLPPPAHTLRDVPLGTNPCQKQYWPVPENRNRDMHMQETDQIEEDEGFVLDYLERKGRR